MKLKLFEYQTNPTKPKTDQLSKKNGVVNNLMESAWSISSHLPLNTLKAIWMVSVVILFVFLLIRVALDERFSDKDHPLFRLN